MVSLLLPLLPQAFVALFGAQAVGVANPVNPMLSAAQIADILRAAGTARAGDAGARRGVGHLGQGDGDPATSCRA